LEAPPGFIASKESLPYTVPAAPCLPSSGSIPRSVRWWKSFYRICAALALKKLVRGERRLNATFSYKNAKETKRSVLKTRQILRLPTTRRSESKVYPTLGELDCFGEQMEFIARNGLPS
jgi:hypothetical protein